MKGKGILMKKRVCLFLVLLFMCLTAYLPNLSVSAETLYEVGQTDTLYTAAAYGRNEWISSDTSIVRIVSYSGQYCTIECLRPGTAYVTIYVHYTKLVWDPWLKMLVNQPCVDKYNVYTIKVRSPQCILANTALSKTTATFSFDAPTNAASVQMLQSSDNGVNWTAAATAPLNSSSNSAVVSGLQPNTNYAFKLSVSGGVRNGDSNVVFITTKANVSGVTLDKTELSIVRGKSATLAASILPDNAENKNVTWSISDNFLASITVNSNGTATIAANDVINGTALVTVRTVEGGYTASCQVNIIDPPPEAPTNLRAVEIKETYVKLAWDASETADYYYVYINSRKEGPIYGTTFTLGDLSPRNTNTYYVTACNEGGESEPSSEIEVTQKYVTAELSVVSITDTTITLNWELGAYIQPYDVLKVIQYRELGDFYFEEKAFINSSKVITYSGFSPNTTYEIRADDEYFESEIITVKTYPSGITVGAKTPRANFDSGRVSKGTLITLTSETPGAAIYYTIDGSQPTTNSMLYTGPIEITRDITIKAVAVKSGLGDSMVAVYNYTVPKPPAYLDINNDGEVNEVDLTDLSGAYGTKESEPGYESSSDFNGDGLIDIFDIVKLAVEL